MYCGHCKGPIAKDKEEWCWYCDAPLCYWHWEYIGHCGHPEAHEINRQSRLGGWEDRARMARALWPDAEHLVEIPEEETN